MNDVRIVFEDETAYDHAIREAKADALRGAASEALVHDQSSWLRYVKETDRAIIEQWLVTLAERIGGDEA